MYSKSIFPFLFSKDLLVLYYIYFLNLNEFDIYCFVVYLFIYCSNMTRIKM